MGAGDTGGYIDMFFCLAEATRCGVAAALYSSVERVALRSGVPKLTAHASLIAQSFFSARGWTIDTFETINRNGVDLERAVMSKLLTPRARPRVGES